MGKRLVTGLLLALLLVLQAQVWFGRGSVPNVRQMQLRLDDMSRQNQQAQGENERLASEVRDLKEVLDMVEEKARFELGMVKANEIYVQIAR